MLGGSLVGKTLYSSHCLSNGRLGPGFLFQILAGEQTIATRQVAKQNATAGCGFSTSIPTATHSLTSLHDTKLG